MADSLACSPSLKEVRIDKCDLQSFMKIRCAQFQAFLFGAVLLLTLPAVMQAQLTFMTNSGSITITGYSGNPTIVNIPGTINGYPVTGIASNAFLSRLTLTRVTIPDSVTNIGNFAFDQCSGMTNIIFSNGVTTIGIGAFIQCLGLTNLTIPDNIVTIGAQAFYSCHNLTNIVIGSGVTSVGSGAFDQCSSLTSIIIPNNVTTIGSQAFMSCTRLINIIIGSGVTNIGPYTLDGCTHLASATVGAPSIESTLFSWFGGFNSFPALTSITLLNSVTNIGIYAFTACSSLTNVTIGDGVSSIATNAFYACINLLAITVAPNNNSYSSVNGVLFDTNQSTLIQYALGLRASNYTVPSSVTNIGSGAFEFSLYLTGIYVSSNAPSLGANAFSYDNATIYYLPGTLGWGTTFGGLPTALWLPQIQTSDGSFGVQTNQFGFNINWASGQTVVVEACTNLSNQDWQPVQTNILTTGSVYFSDPQWTNYPDRFYRLHSP
jgi:BspA type Leucine rich repeat region (6 copies)